MAAPLEVDHERVVDLGAHVGVAVGEIGERGPDVEPGEDPGGLLDPADRKRHGAPQRVDQLRLARRNALLRPDRKSTRLNSSHGSISYAVFCLKKKRHPSELDRLESDDYTNHLQT